MSSIQSQPPSRWRGRTVTLAGVAVVAAALVVILLANWLTQPVPADQSRIAYHRRYAIDTGGFLTIGQFVVPWKEDATLAEIASAWDSRAEHAIARIDQELAESAQKSARERFVMLNTKAILLNYAGRPKKAYQVLDEARSVVESSDLARQALYSVIYFQGVTALRLGETDNCVMCRGESSCILPINPAARHTNPEGSRLAIRHFTEYLAQFPDDAEVRWLLNIAHMTLGEHPQGVDPRYLISLDHFTHNEFNIGKFRDIGHAVGLDHLTQGGGGIMEDFDNDGLLDIAITSYDPTEPMRILRNTGTGSFEDRTTQANVRGQLGGLNCVQTDYNNDGRMDIFIVRGAWLPVSMPLSLLRNESDGTFTDVTREAGISAPVNSIAASWADFDNDGWLDLFVCCERQASLLYRNLGNGTFEDVAAVAGVSVPEGNCKGVAWLDYDNDSYPDLFLNFLTFDHGARLYHNNRDGTFEDVSAAMGIDGPTAGFACWAWDYNNDGWLDIFATCYEKGYGEVVKGLLGQPHQLRSNRLFLNQQGKGFKDVTKDSGLDHVFATMGCNFGDLDNDGFLDMYLGTGDPDLAALMPNRMFRNVAGQRFSDVTASSGTGSLQKGHGTAIGDWDRDGNVDIFIEMGGAINGDKYHNILFQNPGHDHHWLTIKLTGDKSNRPAIGARLKIVTAGDQPQTIYRHISSGSSFGANPLEQTIGLGKADRIDLLEITWPTSGTTQTFRDVACNQSIAVTEFAESFQKLDQRPIKLPELDSKPKMVKPQL